MDRLSPNDPHRIGNYRLIARLGSGGMGQVYLARSERGRTVAVKTIRPSLALEPDFRRRFAMEITAARRVGGRWTAPVLDADTEADSPWVATGYIAGPSLHEVVSRQFGTLPVRSTTLLANGLVHALRAIHGAGLVHRDLKPSNVLLTIDGPRVIDFGIARALDTMSGGVTRTGATVGSPGFMSPEQVRGGTLTPASDVFCLGSLLAYAATGRTPFGALDSGVHILMFRIAEEEPRFEGLPEPLRHIIGLCLAKQPERRPSLDELESLTAPDDGDEPWLPAPLIAQLGRHAVELLDSEGPDSGTGHEAVRDPNPTPPSRPAGTEAPFTPRQVPSPYAHPSPAYVTSAPLSGVTGTFGPTGSAPYSVAPRAGGGSRRWNGRRTALALGAAVAAVAVVAGIAIAANGSGAGGEVAEEYVGVWQGEYEAEDDSTKLLRFEIEKGSVGDTIGTATVLTPSTLCTFDMELESAGDELEFTEDSRESVPASQRDEACRDNRTPQRLALSADGTTVEWAYSSQSATLDKAEPSDGEDMPAELLGTYGGEWANQDDGDEGTTTVVVEQGAVGDQLVTYTQDGGQMKCTWRNHLVQVDGDEVVMGPDVIVDEESDADCFLGYAFRMWLEDDAIQIDWIGDGEDGSSWDRQ
ncbi:serine/threonine-protein kinase [Streptomyces sp. RFCAC02]|uniref:serine/threonine protein kinase n=1 Tax=Streptomyces sp. RFCAC02 TaxID=2499143 RepID=UPI001F0F347D|nr:serine/threonine-protein kinase [Streptomyces sp. RFCAC02]